MGERFRHHPAEMWADLESRLATDRQTHHRGPDARRRLECPGPHVEQGFRFHPGSEHHREPSVFGRIRPRSDAIHHFTLKHHVQVVDDVRALQQMKQERRRDVVRQVAHDAQATSALSGERSEVEFERVDFVHGDARFAANSSRSTDARSRSDLDEIERRALP